MVIYGNELESIFQRSPEDILKEDLSRGHGVMPMNNPMSILNMA